MWSEGVFGIHEYRSRIKIRSDELGGRATTFTWENDHAVAEPLKASYMVAGNSLGVTSSPIVGCDTDVDRYATVQLQLGQGVDWWKSLQFEYDGQTVILEADGTLTGAGPSSNIVRIDESKLATPHVLVLQTWLAKSFGIHEHWGNVSILFDSMVCKETVFIWETN